MSSAIPRGPRAFVAFLLAACAWAAPVVAQEDMLVPWGPYWASGPATINGAGGGGGTITAGTAPCATYYSGATILSSNCALEFQPTEVVVNNAGSPVMDFRVEGDTQTHLLFVDASADFVGVGTSAPLSVFHIDSNAANTVPILTFENTAGNCQVFRVDATPEGAVTGSICDTAYDGTNGTMYIKASGNATNTGWVQLTTGTGSVNPGTAPRVAYYSAANTIDSNAALEFQPTEAVFNQSGSAAMDLRVEGDVNASLFFVDASAEAVEITRTGGSGHALNITGGTLTSGTRSLMVIGTLPNAPATQVGAETIITTTAGGAPTLTTGQNISLVGGAGTTSFSRGLNVANTVVGGGVTPISANGGNFGIYSSMASVTPGTQLGVYGTSTSGLGRQYGVVGYAAGAGSAAADIGVYGTADGSSPAGVDIGVMASLYGGSDSIGTLVDTALLADNAATLFPIFLGRDNGTTVFTIADGGEVTSVPTAGHANNAFTITAGTLASTMNALEVTGTLPDVAAVQIGVETTIGTTAGTNPTFAIGEFVTLNAGTTTAGVTAAFAFRNLVAGTGTTPISTTSANYGLHGEAGGVTTGTNVGGDFVAFSSSGTNFGSMSRASDGATLNIGAYGTALNATTNIGGMFTLYGQSDTINANVSSALIADNGAAASNIFTARDNGTTVFTIADGGDVTDAPVVGHAGNALTVTAGTLATTKNALSVTGTIPSSASTEVGVSLITTAAAGAGAAQRFGTNVFLTGPWTGSLTNFGLVGQTDVAGTGTGSWLAGSALGNVGTFGGVLGATAGHNSGLYGSAGGSSVQNVGVFGDAHSASASALFIGVVGQAQNTTLADEQIGGFFRLVPAGGFTTPTFTKDAALMADNSTEAEDIFVARDNGTPVFTVPDAGGFSVLKQGANTIAIETVANTGGDYQVFRTDATPEGSVTGSIGDWATDTTNGVVYLKVTGNATNTGWVANGGTGGTITAGIVPQVAYYSGVNTISSNAALEFQAAESVFNQSGLNVDLRVEGDINSSLFFVDASEEAVSVIRGAGPNPGHAFTITGGTLASTKSALVVTGTLSTAATSQFGEQHTITSSTGGGNVGQFGSYHLMNGAYVGTNVTVAVQGDNVAAGTGTDITNEATALTTPNYGLWGTALGTTVGTNVGTYGRAAFSSTLDIGLVGTANLTPAGTTHVGVVGLARQGVTNNVGGYFGFNSANPTFTSSALISDNAALASPIYLGRDNGTIVFTIADGGDVTDAPVAGHAGNALTVTAGTLATTKNALEVTGTLPDVAAVQIGVENTIATTAGTNPTFLVGQYTKLTAGSTTGGTTGALAFENQVSGTGILPITGNANFGLFGQASGSGAGTNVGAYFDGRASTGTNFGTISIAHGNEPTARNIGAYGTASDATTNIGGLFSLYGAGTDTINADVSSALIADNGAIAANIFTARDNGTTTFTIGDSGVTTVNVAGGSAADFNVVGDTNANLIFADVSADMVGIGIAPTSTLHDGGSFAAPQRTVTTTPITVAATDYTIFCDATAAPITINLPTSVGIGGRMYNVKKIDASANTCTVDGSGAQTIDNGATYVISVQYFSIAIQSDNANWWVI